MDMNDNPHKKNVPGPFYVLDRCCTGCMAPHEQAPDMMGFDEAERSCFVRRQPKGKEEVYKAIRAVWSTEFACIRYAGHDLEILRRLAEAGLSDRCDTPLLSNLTFVLRKYVTFNVDWVIGDDSGSPPLWGIATTLMDYLVSQQGFGNSRWIVTPIVQEGDSISFAFSWYEGTQHELTICKGEPNTARWLISHSPTEQPGSQAVSLILDDWLRSDERFHTIRWYTAEAWNSRKPEWQKTPF